MTIFLDFNPSWDVPILLDPVCFACSCWGVWTRWRCSGGAYCTNFIFCQGLVKQLQILILFIKLLSPELLNLEPHDIRHDQRSGECLIWVEKQIGFWNNISFKWPSSHLSQKSFKNILNQVGEIITAGIIFCKI